MSTTNNKKLLDDIDERLGAVEEKILQQGDEIAAEPELLERQETHSEKIRKFVYYRMARAKKTLADGVTKTYEDVWDKITKEELDFYLREALDIPPEDRYQHRRRHPTTHESSWVRRGLWHTGYDGKGCNQFTGCVPECRYYPETGRIEDEEIINEYEKEVEKRRREGTLIEEGNGLGEFLQEVKKNWNCNQQ
jgi:hypothetical protein